MPVLFVTEQGSVLRWAMSSMVVTKDGEAGTGHVARTVLLSVEPHRLEMVGLVGRVHMTLDALHACLERGIGVAWFAWNGRLLGRVVPPMARCGDLRLLQYRAAMDEGMALLLAWQVMEGKLANAAAVLRGIQANYAGLTQVAEAIRALTELRTRIAECQTLPQLLGWEGHAAASYFAAYAAGFRGVLSFSGRQRRPPPDPVNAVLSFGYVLLGNLIGAVLEGRGFDPAVGFYHAVRSGRASLALDLLEEFRHPVVDRFALRTINLKILRPEMFEPDPDQSGGVRLTAPGLKIFFRAWGEHLDRPIADAESSSESGGLLLTPMQLLRRQVDRLAFSLRHGEPYRPFLLRG
ncbi:MAG: CRISPR-associated endonuclease Cas1 [Magnetococcales bacterium]|nr:CRISPR-associated endonuclease Cas1 [Magnetococcales bacterium]